NRLVRLQSGDSTPMNTPIPRHEGLVPAANDRLAGRCTARTGNDVQGVVDLRIAEEVALYILELRDAHLAVGIVGPGAVDRALHTAHLPEYVRGVVVLRIAALDAATDNEEVDLTTR